MTGVRVAMIGQRVSPGDVRSAATGHRRPDGPKERQPAQDSDRRPA